MSFIHESVIERKALELLTIYSRNHSWHFSFPIPIDLIIELELGYDNAVADLGDPLILGAISPLENTIYTNERSEEQFEKYQGLYRFTLGHEVGHWALHLNGSEGQMKISEEFPYPFICRDTSTKPPIEKQADMFSSAILMPTDLVKESVAGRDIFSWSALYQLRDEWGVSVTALKIRLEKLGLLYHCQQTDQFFTSEARANGQQSLFV